MAVQAAVLRAWLDTLGDSDVVGFLPDDPTVLGEYESYYGDGPTKWFDVGDIDTPAAEGKAELG